LQRRKTRTRQLELGAALAAALCLAGCGAGAERRGAPQPKLPRPLALALAQRSDRVAAALDAGDPCRAFALAEALQQQTIAAVNSGRVPGPFLEPLQATANDLAGRIVCVVPPEDDDEEKGRGKGNDKGKGKKDDKGDD
jgi:hypothetical protein